MLDLVTVDIATVAYTQKLEVVDTHRQCCTQLHAKPHKLVQLVHLFYYLQMTDCYLHKRTTNLCDNTTHTPLIFL